MSVREKLHETPRKCVPAVLERTSRGILVRCPEHRHLLGILVGEGKLEIKCGDEYVVVEVTSAN